MPIKDKTLYPPDWRAISTRIKFERAQGRCEQCGVHHLALGARDLNGTWHDSDAIAGMNSTDCFMLFGDEPRKRTIILTCAHLDHDPTNNADENLAALCQRCHLRHDAQHHARNAAQTRKRRNGQQAIEFPPEASHGT